MDNIDDKTSRNIDKSESVFKDLKSVFKQDYRRYRSMLIEQEQNNILQNSKIATQDDKLSLSMNLDVLNEGKAYCHKVVNVEPGCLLFSTQQVNKGPFQGSAVLIIEKDHENGTQGIVINKQLPISFQGLECDEALKDCFGDAPLFWGGPLETSWLYFLHNFKTRSSSEFMEGLNFSSSEENIRDLVETLTSGQLSDRYYLRACLGKVAWREKQLRREIENGFWHVASVSSEYATDYCPEELYEVLKEQQDFKESQSKPTNLL